MAADRIQIAEPSPPHCSSCFQAKPSKTHIDFGAAWDGPVIGEGVTMHVIDDLIICEECIVMAARKIGMGFVEKVQAELENAEREHDELMQRYADMKRYAEQLEEIRDKRPAELNGKAKPGKRRAKVPA